MATRREFDDTSVTQACRTARLDLAADRREHLAHQLRATYGLIDALDAVELGETAPATAFDARWTERCNRTS